MIIDGRQNKPKRVLEYFVTVTGWIVMAMFVAEFILTTLFWWVGYHYVRQYLFVRGEGPAMWHIAEVAFVTGAVSFLGMGGWTWYNLRKFGPLRRRRPPLPVTLDELARMFSISERELCQLQEARWVDYDYEVVQNGADAKESLQIGHRPHG